MSAVKSSERVLSRDVVVDRALELADERGRDALTIRGLAQELGVTPMALYWHVKNKDELLAAMGARFFDHVAIPSEGDWAQKFEATLNALIESLRRHPAAAHLAPQQVLQCESGRQIAEQSMQWLSQAGFDDVAASDIARTAMLTTTMLVTELAGAEPGVAREQREAVRLAKRQAIEALPAGEFPQLRHCAVALTECTDEEAYYAFGVELFMAGVRALHAGLPAPQADTAESVGG